MKNIQLSSMSVAQLRKSLLEDEARVTESLLLELESDNRSGVQQLGRHLRERQKKADLENQRLEELLKYEKELWAEGKTHLAGVDEAGVAPLAGPVVAGAVILPKGYRLRGLDDSKKILDERKRDKLAEAIKQDALAWASGWATVEEVDALNIYHASLLAMKRAVDGLKLRPEFCLVDARTIPDISMPQRGLIHGDALSLSIAAASIIAKTTRDTYMNEMDKKYPGYGFARHKGYPTPEHQKALKALGAVDIHRRSFALVKEALGMASSQTSLFQS